MGSEKKMPFAFVLDYLYTREPIVRPMFGSFAVYIQDKLVLVLRKRTTHPRDNGVWLATSHEHHESLHSIFPYLRPVFLLGNKPSAWRNIPDDAPDFEEAVIMACELIGQNDPRIGVFPRKRSRKR
jgi:hypothetical protein